MEEVRSVRDQCNAIKKELDDSKEALERKKKKGEEGDGRSLLDQLREQLSKEKTECDALALKVEAMEQEFSVKINFMFTTMS